MHAADWGCRFASGGPYKLREPVNAVPTVALAAPQVPGKCTSALPGAEGAESAATSGPSPALPECEACR